MNLPALQTPGTVLVVDDEPLIRELLGMMLAASGYKVFEAESGAAALALAEARPDVVIDFLLTDLCMPGMSGSELAHALRLLRPGIREIYISGYTAAEISAMGIDLRAAACVTKPFHPAAIEAALRSVRASMESGQAAA